MKSGKSTVLITVGIPVYNGERFIYRAIKSVLDQTYTNFELIVTDDGSADNTLQILNSFNDPRLKVVSDGKNRGIAYRLNQQIEMAQGEYFVRMDGDDMMFPDRIEKQLEYLLENVELEVCGGNVVVIDNDNRILGSRNVLKIPLKISEIFIHGRFIHPTVMGKTKWFKKWKYKSEMNGCEDLDLWIRSFYGSKTGNCPLPVLFYRDPLDFKVKTFMMRQFRIMRCIWKNRKYLNNLIVFIQCYMKVFITIICSLSLWSIGYDRIWIRRRNSPISAGEQNRFKELLKDFG